MICHIVYCNDSFNIGDHYRLQQLYLFILSTQYDIDIVKSFVCRVCIVVVHVSCLYILSSI